MSSAEEIVNKTLTEPIGELPEPVIIGSEAYISAEYARAERDKLWRRVWLQAGRLEDIPEGRQLHHLRYPR